MSEESDFGARVADLAALRAWSARNLPEFTLLAAAEPLTGGLLNHVWRLRAEPFDLVLKWSTEALASAPEISLDPSRARFEARALHAWATHPELLQIAADIPRVQVPALHFASQTPWIVVMEYVEAVGDLGEHETAFGAPDDAHALGRWLARLHAATHEDESLAEQLRNAPVQATRAEVQYDALAASLDARDPRAARTLRRLGEQFKRPGCCMIMGDLWPPSVLVGTEKLHVIDWEFSHFGHPAQDVGHFAAHLWMRAHRAGSSLTQLASFMRGYMKGERLDLPADFSARTREHFGAEILARTIGAFSESYLYAGLAAHDSPVEEAVEVALAAIRGEATHPLAAWGGGS